MLKPPRHFWDIPLRLPGRTPSFLSRHLIFLRKPSVQTQSTMSWRSGFFSSSPALPVTHQCIMQRVLYNVTHLFPCGHSIPVIDDHCPDCDLSWPSSLLLLLYLLFLPLLMLLLLPLFILLFIPFSSSSCPSSFCSSFSSYSSSPLFPSLPPPLFIFLLLSLLLLLWPILLLFLLCLASKARAI